MTKHGHLGEHDNTREDWLAYTKRTSPQTTWETLRSSVLFYSALLGHRSTNRWRVCWRWPSPQRRRLMSWSDLCKTTINCHYQRVYKGTGSTPTWGSRVNP